MKKIYVYGAALAAAFGLSACDSSSAAVPSGDEAAAKSVDDLSNCTAKKSGQIEDVAGDVTTSFICSLFGEKYLWIPLSLTEAYSDDFKVCNTSKEGQYALASNELTLFVCTDSEWQKVSTFESVSSKTVKNDDDDEDDTPSTPKGSDNTDDDDDEDVKPSKTKNDSDDDEDEGEKVVTFVDGIIWQPSYGRRAWTATKGVDEYNFHDNQEDGGPGWWYKFLDDKELGTSAAAGKFNDDNLTLNFKLEYNDWHYDYGTYAGVEYAYWAPTPYPYAGFGFDLAKKDQSVSVTKFGIGLCVTYTSTGPSRLVIPSENTEMTGIHFYYPLEASAAKNTVNIKWNQFTLPSYAKDHYSILPNNEASMNVATGIMFQYTNDESGVTDLCGAETKADCEAYADAYGSNTLQIYKIGTFGNCNSSIGDSDL